MAPPGMTPLIRVGSRDLRQTQPPTSPLLDAKEFEELWKNVKQVADQSFDTACQLRGTATQEDETDVETDDQDPDFSATTLKAVFQTAQQDLQTTRSGIEALDHSVPRKIVNDTQDRIQGYVRLGQDEEARRALDNALKQLKEEFIDGPHVDTKPWKVCIAELLIEQGRKEEARDVLSEVLVQSRGEQFTRANECHKCRRLGTTENETMRQQLARDIESELDRFRCCEAWDEASEAARKLYAIDPAYFDLARPLGRPATGSDKVRRILLLGLLKEHEGKRATKPRRRGRLLSKALEIYNHGCYARELYDEFFDSHGAKFLLFDHSDGANIFFSAARICTYFDKEGLLDEHGNSVTPRQFRCRGSPLTSRTWKQQALHYLEQGRSRALLNSINKGVMTEKQRKFIQDAVINDMALVARLAVWSKRKETLTASPEPVEAGVTPETNIPYAEDPPRATFGSRMPASKPNESSTYSAQSLRIQTFNLARPSLGPPSNSPVSGLASPQSKEALLARIKIYMRWRKALLYALTKNPTLGAVLPSAGSFGEIEEMISSIPQDTIVVEYALASTAPHGVMTIVAASDGVKAAEWKETNAVNIQQCIAKLRASMSSSPRMRGSTRAIHVPSTKSSRDAQRPLAPERRPSAIFQEQLNDILRDSVVTPVEPYLRGKKKLIIIPSGDLAHVPWAIFFDRPITVVPSLNIWSRLQTQISTSMCQVPRVSVVSNAPKDKDKVKQNLPALRDIPYSRIEAFYIARQHDQWPFIADDKDRDAFEALANGTQVLHLCAHSTFDSHDPMSSSIQLFDEPLTMMDWRQLSIKADLVVFSSCLSGISKAFDSGSTIGFAHTLLGTGTKAFIGSLWPVDDAATLLLMILFYEALRRPLPAAEALYEAQKRMKNFTKSELYQITMELEEVAMDDEDDEFVINSAYYIDQLKKLDVKEMAEEKYWATFVLTGYGSRVIYPETVEER